MELIQVKLMTGSSLFETLMQTLTAGDFQDAVLTTLKENYQHGEDLFEREYMVTFPEPVCLSGNARDVIVSVGGRNKIC